jgi:carbon-monoxide dehydrogenase medium subunit
MHRFSLIEPASLTEACAIVGSGDAQVIAGGTALLTLIKQGIFIPRTLVNLKKITNAGALDYDSQNGLRVGALASIYDVETAPLVRRYYPILAQACHVVANIRIRNMATIGGNIAHGDYQSDPPTALVALDASVEIMSRSGHRRVKLAEFLRGSYETVLAPGELVSALTIPPAHDLKGSYLKFTTGSSEERPCAGVAALARIQDGVCQELRLVVGALSPRPARIHKGEEMARQQRITGDLLERLGAEASRCVDPMDDVRGSAEYKRHLAGVLVRRAVAALARE